MKPRATLLQMHYFVAVAEELHFGRAADRVHIAQPALSQQIQRLEQRIGGQLFYRSSRGVRLTEAGRVLLPKARLLLAEAEAAVAAAQRASRGEEGALTVGFAASTSFAFLPELVRMFREQRPRVELKLRELSTAAQLEAVETRAIDIGFVRAASADPPLRCEVIMWESFVAVLPGDHPLAKRTALALEDLSEDPFVLFPRHVAGALHDHVYSLFRAAGYAPRLAQEALEWQTIVALVDGGVGVSLVPASFQNVRVGRTAYVPLAGVSARVPIAACYREGGLSPAAAALLALAWNFGGEWKPIEAGRTM